jgi:hypothetical protein
MTRTDGAWRYALQRFEGVIEVSVSLMTPIKMTVNDTKKPATEKQQGWAIS